MLSLTPCLFYLVPALSLDDPDLLGSALFVMPLDDERDSFWRFWDHQAALTLIKRDLIAGQRVDPDHASNVFDSCRDTFKDLYDLKWTEMLPHLNTFNQMLEVLNLVKSPNPLFEKPCIDSIAFLTKACAPHLRQTHRLIHIISSTMPDMLAIFEIERGHYVTSYFLGLGEDRVEMDPSEKLLVRLELRMADLDSLRLRHVTEISDLCETYMDDTMRATRLRRHDDDEIENYYPLQLFAKIVDFIKVVDKKYCSWKPMNREFLNRIIDYVAELLMWTKDEDGLNQTIRMLERKHHSLATELLSHRFVAMMVV